LKKKKEKQEEDIEKFTKRVLENIDKIEKILTVDPEVKEKAKKIKKILCDLNAFRIMILGSRKKNLQKIEDLSEGVSTVNGKKGATQFVVLDNNLKD